MRKRVKLGMCFASILAIGVCLPVLADPAAPAASLRVDASPWGRVLYDDAGRVLSASGRESSGEPVSLNVSTSMEDNRLVATTTYVRGRQALTIERVYDAYRGLLVTYSTDEESVSVSLEGSGADGTTVARYDFPGDEPIVVGIDSQDEAVSGEVDRLHRALEGSSRIMGLIRRYAHDTGQLSGALPEAGDSLMFRVPDGGCLDECAMGCGAQCAWECLWPTSLPCGICNTACAAGCFIGCTF